LITQNVMPKTLDKAELDRVDCCLEDNWNGGSRCLRRLYRSGATERGNHIHLVAN
jgi:hypothetical protein